MENGVGQITSNAYASGSSSLDEISLKSLQFVESIYSGSRLLGIGISVSFKLTSQKEATMS